MPQLDTSNFTITSILVNHKFKKKTYSIPSLSIHHWSTSNKDTSMSSQNEDHSQSFDSSYTFHAIAGMLLGRNYLLDIVDDGERHDQVTGRGFLVFAAVNAIDLKHCAEHQNSSKKED